jgi:hypothetical protein
MSWTDPTTRSTGDLITAAIWNAEVVDNLGFLHDREVSVWIPYVDTSGTPISLGNMPVTRLTNTGGAWAKFSFPMPDDFDTLVGLDVVLVSSVTTTLEYDLGSDYGAEGETYNNHSEALLNQTIAATIDEVTLVDASEVFSNLAAGDVCGLAYATSYGGVSAYHYVLGLWLRYLRT